MVALLTDLYCKDFLHYLQLVLRIHDILVQIRIRGSVPLTNRS
jgi:hypothetical protein